LPGISKKINDITAELTQLNQQAFKRNEEFATYSRSIEKGLF